MRSINREMKINPIYVFYEDKTIYVFRQLFRLCRYTLLDGELLPCPGGLLDIVRRLIIIKKIFISSDICTKTFK